MINTGKIQVFIDIFAYETSTWFKGKSSSKFKQYCSYHNLWSQKLRNRRRTSAWQLFDNTKKNFSNNLPTSDIKFCKWLQRSYEGIVESEEKYLDDSNMKLKKQCGNKINRRLQLQDLDVVFESTISGYKSALLYYQTKCAATR